MSSTEEVVDVDVPVSVAYNQWTQFEEFPSFMEGIESVTQLDDTRLRWVAEIGGVRREWVAEIIEQRPDERVAWRATDGATNAGTVRFQPVSDRSTRVSLHLDFEPEGLVEQVGDKLGVVKRRASGDLERFKEFIERSGQESGAWRGDVG